MIGRKTLILQDKNILPDIYNLRVYAWQNSPGRKFLNHNLYPFGYKDELDQNSIHFVTFSEKNEIVAASRLTICHDLSNLPYPNVFKYFKNFYPKKIPFSFYSRLVIHPEYRKIGLKEQHDLIRMKHHAIMKLNFGLATSFYHRIKDMEPHGWKNLGPIPNNIDPDYSYEDTYLLLFKNNLTNI